MSEWSGLELARMFADTAKVLAAQNSFGATVEDIVGLAVSVVPGAEAAALSLARNGKVETPAATDDLARKCDTAQYETGQGPCLDAVWEDRLVRIDDMTAETRWPAFAERAAALGARSLLSCHLSSERGSLSALNLYARTPGAFDAQSESIALIYAAHATIALEWARLESDLRTAVETRQGIGQAVGILMERDRLTAKQAFDVLVRTSQDLNVKLRELAAMVVHGGSDRTETGRLARRAAEEAGDRAQELHDQLRSDPTRVRGSTPEQLATAARRAASAGARANSSLERAAGAKFAAAEAHDRAALLHDKQAAEGRADAAEHEHQAEEHRRAAASARAAARAELDQLD